MSTRTTSFHQKAHGRKNILANLALICRIVVLKKKQVKPDVICYETVACTEIQCTNKKVRE